MNDIKLFEQTWPEGEYRFFQLGFVVEDIIASAFKWAEVHGVGPFHVLPRMTTPCSYRGAPSSVDMQVAVAQAGPVQIELIKQYDDSPSVLREAVGEGKSVFHQLCTVTKDYDAKKAHYEKLGYSIGGEILGAMRVAYVDTTKDFGYYTEIVEHSDGFLKQLGKVAATCRDWDGADPVRILTRDGYRTPT
jgi:hypothetical protein